MLRAIPSSEISVVIQGPLFRDHADGDLALRCVRSVREHLPDAEIIVSTWESEDASGLDADRVIFSNDPGPTCYTNLARQIVSTGAGIAVADRPFVLKLRADLSLTGAAITEADEIEDNPAIRRFSPGASRHRITTTNLFVRNPVLCGALFHPSDLVMFGPRSSLRNFWHEVPVGMHFNPDDCAPEQWLMHRYMALLTLGAPQTNFNPLHVGYSERVLAANFHVVDWERSGVRLPARLAVAANNIYLEREIIVIRQQTLAGTYRAPRLRSLGGLLRSRWKPLFYRTQAALLQLFPRSLKDRVKRLLA
jgi:hypothetical protein